MLSYVPKGPCSPSPPLLILAQRSSSILSNSDDSPVLEPLSPMVDGNSVTGRSMDSSGRRSAVAFQEPKFVLNLRGREGSFGGAGAGAGGC